MRRVLLSLLVFCSVFQASSVVSFGGLGLSPYYFVSIPIACAFAYDILRNGLRLLIPNLARPLLWFWLWAALCTASCPLIFKGLSVIDPRAGLEAVLEAPVRLSWSFGNLAQMGFLTLNVIVVLYAAQKREDLQAAFKWAAITVSAFVIIESVCFALGWRFPYSLINNNPGYSQGNMSVELGLMRPAGTFAEPSIAGAFFAALATGSLAAFLSGRMRPIAPLCSIGLLALVGSGAGFAGFALACIALLATFFPARGWHLLSIPNMKHWAALVGLAAIAFLIPAFVSHIAEYTVQKQNSFSVVVRAAMDMFGLNLAKQTYGLGVGLGSVRASSFLVTLLATLGLPGVVLFAWFLWRLKPNWYLAGLLCAMCVGIPDLSLTILWAAIILSCDPQHNRMK